ncbi:tetratricopeptide repeat protein [Kosmotoga pacifica]|uniref:Uncharacterized protein n=1 Tax=Kosmotoga pacifica TaxID=1330330 RepID=A0A0G2ZA98_9BACT|nr:tetratricopeptide repeat protein [Kosmotoga pacifica]AKI96499.1 hypothetical protein IX53_00145 [Kosmotoga pacifica]
MIKRIFLFLFVFSFSIMLGVSVEDAVDLILSPDYIYNISSLEEVGDTELALKAIGNGLVYIETLEWNYKDRFFDYLERVRTENLPKDFQYSLEIVETLVATSTVSSLNLIDFEKTSDLSKAVAVRIYFLDWQQTKDPNSGKKATTFAQELIDRYPNAYFLYKVLFYYHSHSSFGSKEFFEALRQKAIILNPDDDILATIIEGEYNLGMYAELLEDYELMDIPDDNSRFFAAYANIKLGQLGTAEIILKNTAMSKLPKKYASVAYQELGKIAEEEGNVDSAIFYYRKAIENDSNNRQAMIRLGLAYLNSDEKDRYTLARFYLEMSGMEEYDDQVASTLQFLRRKLILDIILKQIGPLIGAVVFGLFFLEYFFNRRRKKQEERAKKES